MIISQIESGNLGELLISLWRIAFPVKLQQMSSIFNGKERSFIIRIVIIFITLMYR